MNPNNWLRAVGIFGIVASYLTFTQFGDMVQALIVAIGAIISLVSPEVLDTLPYGPNK